MIHQVLSQARCPILHSADNVRGPAYQATTLGASTVRPDVLDQATCQQDLG